MADQEVAKHTKNVYKIWNSREHSLLHKIKEFVVEIVIIVFAVTLSIWLHDRSEHAHQQKEVKEFLLGLKQDLVSDIKEMQEDKKSYQKSRNAFRYITSIKINQTLNQDSINKHYDWLFNNTGLVSNNGRFEGFRSAGKIGTIENKALQNNIMDLYQESIPDLLLSTDYYNAFKNKLLDYCDKNVKKITDSTSNIAIVLSADEGQNIATNLTYTGDIFRRYDACINKSKEIISAIDKEYGE